ncbi:LysE family translocator [Actibacterium ureilyticum]|uniref:LysE family translocator n=1 Tax=Actibacterium ureilyticum TaxID=1590614 RepID=UPI000BAB2438|nr:LysE family translocator [Actibacterium ureilyticum]
MTYELLPALIGFAFVSTMTPGPNNLMLLASGANFGFLRTVPHMLGIGIGFALMVFLVGVGLMQVFVALPPLRMVMQALSIAFLLYLAWKIATAAPPAEGAATGRPLTFLQAAAFQWVNPKAWAMGMAAVTTYAPGSGAWAALVVASAFAFSSLFSTTGWTALGQQLRRWLSRPGRLRAFNLTMALLLLATLYPILLG